MKKLCILLALLVMIPCSVRAAIFRAEVDRDTVTSGDSVTLQLTLSGAKATQGPDLSALDPTFNIVSQGQSSSTEIFNGSSTTSTGWVLTLVPKGLGQAIIPAISIKTDTGTLRSDPITITVAKGAPPPSTSSTRSPQPSGSASTPASTERAVTIDATVDNTAPYQNQPIHYTVRVYARTDIADVGLQDPVMDNAVVEKNGQPDSHQETINGQPVRVILFHYLITPLQPGKMTIPPTTLQGQVENMAARQQFSPFANNSFADPFRMMQTLQSMSGFAPMVPFSISSNAIAINVAAPPVAMNPWLPLNSLKIKEDYDDNQIARVGEPLTRKLSLLADGGTPSQLPSLESQQNHTDFKVYADKPRTGTDTGNSTDTDHTPGASYAWRDESYSLIPTRSGKLTMPAIHVPYWNLKTNHIDSADLPARIVDVQPAPPGTAAAPPPVAANPAATAPASAAANTPQPATATTSLPRPKGPILWLYGVIALLLIIVAFVVFWGVRMQQRINRIVTGNPQPAAPPKPAPVRTPAALSLEAAKTPQDLNRFLQGFAHDRWALPVNAALETIFATWPKPLSGHDDRMAMAHDLGAALYANKTADMADMKRRVRDLIAAIPPAAKPLKKSGEKLPGLNPE